MTGAELCRVANVLERGDISAERGRAERALHAHARPLAELMVAAEYYASPGGGVAAGGDGTAARLQRIHEAVRAVHRVGVRIQPGWRAEPPSASEVGQCSTWWYQPAVGEPRLITVIVMTDGRVGIPYPASDDAIRWAPALPPAPPDGSEVRP